VGGGSRRKGGNIVPLRIPKKCCASPYTVSPHEEGGGGKEKGCISANSFRLSLLAEGEEELTPGQGMLDSPKALRHDPL